VSLDPGPKIWEVGKRVKDGLRVHSGRCVGYKIKLLPLWEVASCNIGVYEERRSVGCIKSGESQRCGWRS
jgi:hypothetical protein